MLNDPFISVWCAVLSPRSGLVQRQAHRWWPAADIRIAERLCRGRHSAKRPVRRFVPQTFPVIEQPSSTPRNRYLSFFSRLPSMSNSRFSPPLVNPPFPLSLSPVIVNLYSMLYLLSPSTRSA